MQMDEQVDHGPIIAQENTRWLIGQLISMNWKKVWQIRVELFEKY